LRDHPLYLGLSTKVDINVHDLSGASLSKVPAWPAAMQTNVYADQDAGVAAEIDKIVRANLQGYDEPEQSVAHAAVDPPQTATNTPQSGVAPSMAIAGTRP